jgi:hypothetical protein
MLARLGLIVYTFTSKRTGTIKTETSSLNLSNLLFGRQTKAMGNYLLSLRVPPPTPEEDERNHPLYYDWSIPKYSPFRQPASSQTVAEKQTGASGAKSTESTSGVVATVGQTGEVQSLKTTKGTVKDASSSKNAATKSATKTPSQKSLPGAKGPAATGKMMISVKDAKQSTTTNASKNAASRNDNSDGHQTVAKKSA